MSKGKVGVSTMKRLVICLAALLALLPRGSDAMITDHPNFANITTLVQSIITVAESRQAEYFVSALRYFQGLRIPEIGEDDYGALLEEDKLDGIRTEKINLTIKPDDINETWADFDKDVFKVTLRLPIHISINVVQDPDGNWGWVLTAEFWYQGIDPDEFGHYGDHWLFHHSFGVPFYSNAPMDTWYCESDTPS